MGVESRLLGNQESGELIQAHSMMGKIRRGENGEWGESAIIKFSIETC